MHEFTFLVFVIGGTKIAGDLPRLNVEFLVHSNDDTYQLSACSLRAGISLFFPKQ